MTMTEKVRFQDLFPIIERTLASNNTFTFCAFGISMLPFIRNGKDLVTLGAVTEKLSKNDVIFYRRANGQFVLHRIIKVCSDGTYHLCGDNQYSVEKGIENSQVIAKLVRLEKDGKEIALHSPSRRFWYFLLPLRRFFLHAKSAFYYRIITPFKK